MKRVYHVALAFAVSPPHHARLVQGIADYARAAGNWSIHFPSDGGSIALADLRGWNGTGLIASIETHSQANTARRMKVPVINLSGTLRDAWMPRVMVDHAAIGRVAAEHLLQCGLRHLAYYGPQRAWYSELRHRGFAERTVEGGGQCTALRVSDDLPWRSGTGRGRDLLTRWLQRLTLPVGILAATDFRAAMVVDACMRLGLRVPDDVAVLGTGNHEITCDFCQVPLSSVSRNGWKVGYEAASLLDRMMTGEEPSCKEVLLPPEGVVARRSTEFCAVDDEHVATAIRFIREHVDRPFGVKQLLQLVPISRRWLEHRFEKCLGVTPREYICRVRVQRAQQLLTGSEMYHLTEIARKCGFSSVRRFQQVFEHLTGVTPARYRQSMQNNR